MPFIDVGGKKLFYARVDAETNPKSSSPVLVFIHGLGSSHAFYIPVMHGLATSGYTSVALDVYGKRPVTLLREGDAKYCLGSGQSVLIPGVEPPTFDTIASDVEGLLKGLNIPSDNAVAVGHSMGGIVVPMLASKCRLRGAILIGPVLPKPALADIFNARIETVKKG